MPSATPSSPRTPLAMPKPFRIVHDLLHAQLAREVQRHEVARFLKACPQGGETVKGFAVIFRLPKQARLRALRDKGRVEDAARGREAMFERYRIDEGLESRARLPLGLRGPIELARMEVEAAGEREDSPVMRIHGDERAVRLGDLPQRIGRAPRGGLLCRRGQSGMICARIFGRRRIIEAAALHIDDIPDRENLLGARDLGAKRPVRKSRARPFQLRERNDAHIHVEGFPKRSRAFAHNLMRRPQADRCEVGRRLENDREPPRRQARLRRDLPKRHRPKTSGFQSLDRTAPAAFAIIGDESLAERLVGQGLQARRKRRAHRQASAKERLAPIEFRDAAAHLFGKIGRDSLVRRLARRNNALNERLGSGPPLLIGRDESDSAHSLENPVAAIARALPVPDGMIIARPLRKRGEIGHFGKSEIAQILPEIVERRRRHAVAAETHIDLIQIKFENPLLGERPLETQSEKRLLDLALDAQILAQKKVARDLLRDRGAADRPLAAQEAQRIHENRARDASHIETVMREEVAILRREEGMDEARRDLVIRHEESLLPRIFCEEEAVIGVEAREDMGLMIREVIVSRNLGAHAPEKREARGEPREREDGGAHGGICEKSGHRICFNLARRRRARRTAEAV